MEANTRVYWDSEARHCVVKEVLDNGQLVICSEANPAACWEVAPKDVRPQSEIEGVLVVDPDFWGDSHRGL